MLDQLGEAFGAHAYAREILRPGRNHLPVESLATRTFFGLGGGVSLFVATGQCGCCKAYTRSCENLTTLHVITPCCCTNGLSTGIASIQLYVEYHRTLHLSSLATTYVVLPVATRLPSRLESPGFLAITIRICHVESSPSLARLSAPHRRHQCRLWQGLRLAHPVPGRRHRDRGGVALWLRHWRHRATGSRALRPRPGVHGCRGLGVAA
ncbi:hypothetical protein D3C80_1501910 [compost metagenome]